jgi:hypothetical protein
MNISPEGLRKRAYRERKRLGLVRTVPMPFEELSPEGKRKRVYRARKKEPGTEARASVPRLKTID